MVKKTTQYRLLLMILGILIFQNGQSQNYDTISNAAYKILAHETILNLKDGIIIVALPSNKKKIDEIEYALNRSDLDKSQINRLSDLKKDTEEKTAEFNLGMISAMQSQFDFCQFVFTYDFHINDILKNEYEGIFLSYYLMYDVNRKIEPNNRYILFKGITDPSTTQGISAMILKNVDNSPLYSPLPYYARLHKSALRCILFGLFNKEECDIQYEKIVEKWNADLHRFHKKVKSKRPSSSN